MKRTTFLLAFVFALLIASLATASGGLLLLAIPLILYLVFALLGLPDEIELEVSRLLDPERADPNEPVTVRVIVRNRGADLSEVLIEDILPDGLILESGSPRSLVALPGGGEAVMEYVVSAPRGTYHFENVRIEIGDVLGLTRQADFLPAPGQLFVIPNVLRLKNISIRPLRTRVYTGSIPARVGGSGSEFFGVRNYQPGDSSRIINWRASARHEEIYSNEYQQERVADVGIVVDARKHSNLFAGDHSIFDHSVVAAAALADVFLSQGNRVGMLIQSSMLNWTFPSYGKIQRERIMRDLMHAHVGDNPALTGLHRLSFSMFPAESQIVLVSPLITDPLLADDLDALIQWRARGYQVLVVIPDPVSFELSLLPSSSESDLAGRVVYLERKVALRRLLHAGIHVVEWDVSKPFDQAVSPYLSRPFYTHPVGRIP